MVWKGVAWVDDVMRSLTLLLSYFLKFKLISWVTSLMHTPAHHYSAIFLSRICCRTKTATHKVINSELKWLWASKKSAFLSQSSAAHLLVKLFQWIIATALRKEPSQLITNWAEYESLINSSFCELFCLLFGAESMIRGDWKWKVLADAAFRNRFVENRCKRQNNNKIVN